MKPEKQLEPIIVQLDGTVTSYNPTAEIRTGKKDPDGVWRWSDGEEFLPSSPQ